MYNIYILLVLHKATIMYLSRHVFVLTDMFVKQKKKPTDFIPLWVIVSDITSVMVITENVILLQP